MTELVLLLAAMGLIVALSARWLAQTDDPVTEIRRCAANPLYFVWHYCRIKDGKTRRYVPFALWPGQVDVLKLFCAHRFVVLLKARQIGMTTLVTAHAVWVSLFRPGSTILLFSKRQGEAKAMLKRIKTMIRGLPEWLQPGELVTDATQELELSNGSHFITFASRGPGGDSYTAQLVVIDEADLIPNLNELLDGAEPTVAADGQMIILSRSNKSARSDEQEAGERTRGRRDSPNSPFKKIYRAAMKGENQFKPMFLPWWAVPSRTQAWYEEQKRSIESRTGSLDDLYGNYPATEEEALAPRELDRRFSVKHLIKVFERAEPLKEIPWPGFAGQMRIYERPELRRSYVIGVDVAEGNPNSDDSVACVLERSSQRQVAILAAKLEPGELAHWVARLAAWYNGAQVLVERNNHGQHCINSLRTVPAEIAPRPKMLVGSDHKYGWWTHYAGKRMMYAHLADSVRCGACLIVDQQTYDQLLSLDSDEMNAPSGEHDDCAIAFAIAIYACSTPTKKPDVTVLSFDRGRGAAEEAARPFGPVVEGVVHMPEIDEWWAQRTRDGSRIDLYGSPKREEAEAAAMAADRMLAVEGKVPRPTDAIEALVWDRLKERGWINA